ncbi:Metal-dependent hydrolase, endonuclease/exonuclease/phosphatase family [Melghirimyces algeriensis]|uniref:Metal-dependent hydrolase, endonuclease/exonuclease/phosphatase family n=2 Tax=Melghirimyces algeriensis TaxID=910412 RepID=A0A521BST2_9BACL|nr:Metal-dependent hydrolase, endonuclease/exonuclease/phosphatase family [Melghirimyces algeriensis]
MKVMVYNIRHGLGCDLRVDLVRIAHVIERERPDLVGLNEVDVRFHRRSHFEDQLSFLAKRLGMKQAFGPSIQKSTDTNAFRGYGNGLLVKGIICSTKNIQVNIRGEESRALLVTDVIPHGMDQRLRVVVTHLGFTPWIRKRQTEQLLKQCDVDVPMVAMGDWNVTPGRSSVTRLFPVLKDVLKQSDVDAPTYPCPSPRKRIDYIFCTRHFHVQDAHVLNTPGCPSDHLPVTCRLALI